MQFIDIQRQYNEYREEINSAIQGVLDSGQFIMGKQVFELEEQLAKYIGVKHCISASSGTDTLVMALMALGIGPGDEVITTPFTFIASAEVIGLVGATPVFVDIDPETYNIDVNQIEQVVTPKTKALLPVNLFGQMPDYEAINAIAARHNLPVIEDGAQSFGATQKGRMSCGMTTIGSTSFFPAKSFGCYGDGGAIFTNDDALAVKMRAIRTHGGQERHTYPQLGINGRCDTLQAAIMLAKFPHFPKEIEARQRIGERYSELLKDCCMVPKVQEGNTHVYSPYTIRVSNRDDLAAALKEKGIPTAVYYPKGVHVQPVFAHLGYTIDSFPEVQKACQEVISLPMHPWLTEEQQDTIVTEIKNHLLARV